MSYRILRPATHEEWLKERAKGIGSSDAGTVMGANPFQTPLGLYLQRKGLSEPARENDAMFNGHILEPAVAEWFAARTGSIIDLTSEGDWIAVDREKDHLRVSPDRLYWPAGTPAEEQTLTNARVLEIKTTSRTVDKDDLPDYWYCQIQYQMGVLGMERGTLCWLSSSPTLHFDCTEVEFNPAFYSALVERVDSFWNGNLLKGIPPADVCAEDTLRRFPQPQAGAALQADARTYSLWKSLKECRGEIKALEEREATLTDSLKMAMAQAETLSWTDTDTGEVRTLATWKSTAKEVFDEEALKRDAPDVWLQYALSQTTVTLDRKALSKKEPELYAKYSSKTTGCRKFLVK